MSEQRVDLSVPQNQPKIPTPAEAVPLPSEGNVYPAGSPLHGAQFVEIRAMTAKDEDILTSRALIKQGKVVDALLKSCVLTKGLDVEDMLAGDRNALIIGIRVTGYGSDYTATVECPQCEAKSEHSFNLSKLPIKPLTGKPLSVGHNAFAFTLPRSGKKVVFKIPTGRDQTELTAALDQIRKSTGLANERIVTTSLHSQILAIDDVTDRNVLQAMVESLPAQDSRALRKHMAEIEPGVDMKQTFICQSCAAESVVEVPLGTEFFWPS
jgi:hypothetical protein